MPEPTTSTAAATLGAATAVTPMLHVAGVSLGLRADLLALGFAGALAAICLLNVVPVSADTRRALVATALRLMAFVLGSSLTAAAFAAPIGTAAGLTEGWLFALAFALGASGQAGLRGLMNWAARITSSANSAGPGNGGAS